MSFEITGIIHRIDDEQTFASGFSKREFVVETVEEKYPQHIKLEVLKDRCSLLDDLNEGDEVTVSFALRGNEHNDRFYVNLVAWKIDAKGGGRSQSASQRRPATSQSEPEPPADEPDGSDDIPF